MAKLAGGQDFGGPASLQNALDMAVNSLKSVPPYGHREVCSLSHASVQPETCSIAVHVGSWCSLMPQSCTAVPLTDLQHAKLHTGLPQASHWLLQVLFMFSGLSSCDPGGIWDSIKQAKQQKCRVSVVGLAAEVFICREITKVCCSCW